ncbi:DUF3291 domain-containing protein [Thalassotalea mangrovi]|uniref:DUF3291 domain-containing protein n=1 Tax=Thalassotalea mangrovi TaxID=2572245 RepID=A0A4U1B1J1_9GAMM|nr:DUF3291 domain-containing protein [Thalassotalea mangrovi]TKB43327.1 DUF3291 domain-containing protein [Thalassotalea mangrovi]
MAIAQLNIAKARWPLTDSRMSGFTSHLDQINNIAERSNGFIWRFIDDESNSQTLGVLKDPLMIANLSLWQSLDTLSAFVYHSEHRNFIKNRKQWFVPLPQASLVLWHHNMTQPPLLTEAVAILNLYRRQGNSPKAFTFAYGLQNTK